MALIWKFTLAPWRDTIEMPGGSDILSAGVQGDDIVIWALCDPEADGTYRRIEAIPTGAASSPSASFVGTVQMNDGLVFHIFDNTKS